MEVDFSAAPAIGASARGAKRIRPGTWPLWLGEEAGEPEHLKAVLRPYPAEGMTCWAVSTRVGNVKNNDRSLIKPIELTAA